MSQENVAIVKALFDAWNAEDMDRLRELYDRKVIVRAPRELAGARTVRGS